jgi:hypothetical protein
MWQTIFLSLERGKESKPALNSLMIFVEDWKNNFNNTIYIIFIITRDPVVVALELNVWSKDVQRNKNTGNG